MAEPEATGHPAGQRQQQEQHRELGQKLPDVGDVPADQERGQGIGLGKAVLTGGEGGEAAPAGSRPQDEGVRP